MVSAVQWRYELALFLFCFFLSWEFGPDLSPEPTNTKGVLPHFNDSWEEGFVEDEVPSEGWLEGLLLSPESVMVRKMRVRNTQDTHEKCAQKTLSDRSN